MEIVRTFEVVEGALYVVQYDDQTQHEIDRVFDCWNDKKFLREFFTQNIQDLQLPIWGGISIEDAINRTVQEAEEMETALLDIAEGLVPKQNLSTFFQPLKLNLPLELQQNKAYGMINPSWLRLYGIRTDVNQFFVSGGAIKLNRKMDDREHLRLELAKLNMTQRYLDENGLDVLGTVTF